MQSYLVRMQNVSVVFTWWTKGLSHGFCLRNCSLGKISRKGAWIPWLTFEGRNRVDALRNDALSLSNSVFPPKPPTPSSSMDSNKLNSTRSFSELELVTAKLPIPTALILSHICGIGPPGRAPRGQRNDTTGRSASQQLGWRELLGSRTRLRV